MLKELILIQIYLNRKIIILTLCITAGIVHAYDGNDFAIGQVYQAIDHVLAVHYTDGTYFHSCMKSELKRIVGREGFEFRVLVNENALKKRIESHMKEAKDACENKVMLYQWLIFLLIVGTIILILKCLTFVCCKSSTNAVKKREEINDIPLANRPSVNG